MTVRCGAAAAAVPSGRPGRPVDRVGLPGDLRDAFELAADLGYDGVEVMVWTDPVSQDAGGAAAAVASTHGVPVARRPRADAADHPAGLGPRAVGQDRPLVRARPRGSGRRRSSCTRRSAGSASTPTGFVEGVAESRGGPASKLAVENMYPWRARSREMQAYLPHWDPVPQPYEHVTLDLSHTATSGSDALAMVARARRPARPPAPRRRHRLRPRTSTWCPGAAGSPAARCSGCSPSAGFAGTVVVEVSTRRCRRAEREADLAEALAFARLHLASARP